MFPAVLSPKLCVYTDNQLAISPNHAFYRCTTLLAIIKITLTFLLQMASMLSVSFISSVQKIFKLNWNLCQHSFYTLTLLPLLSHRVIIPLLTHILHTRKSIKRFSQNSKTYRENWARDKPYCTVALEWRILVGFRKGKGLVYLVESVPAIMLRI
jgi:hypothetical protein